MQKMSELRIGAIITYFSLAFNIIAGVIYTPWMIHQIGQSDYAIYTLANSIISLFLIDFGLSTATTRFVAKYRAEKNEEKVQSFLSAVYKLYLLIDAVILIVFISMYVCLTYIYTDFSALEIMKLKVVFCISALYSLISFPCVTFNGILTAYEKFVPLKTLDLLQKVVAIALTVISLICGLGLLALVLSNAVSGLISIAIKFIYVQKNTKIKFVKNDKLIYKDIFGFSFWATVWALSQRLIFNITPSILGMVAKMPTSAIAVFGIVVSIEGYVYTVTNALNGMFLSRITRIVLDDSDGSRLTRLMTQIGRYQFALNGLVVLGVMLLGKEFLLLWIGKEYISAYACILLVILPGLLYNPLQIATSALIAQNFIKFQALIHVFMGLCNVALSFFFSYLWGVVGASFSIFIAYTVRVILTWVLIKKKLNINFWLFIRKCYLKMSVPFFVSLVVCRLFIHRWAELSWAAFVLNGTGVVLVYAIAVLLFGTDHDEKKALINCIKIGKH